MDRLVHIRGDVYDVADRLKEIDDGYYPVYNLTKHRYEIHHARQKPTLCVVLPYDSLDCRAIDRVLRTRVENVEKFIREMDSQNEKITQDMENRQIDEMRYKANQLGKYIDTTRTRVMPQYKEI